MTLNHHCKTIVIENIESIKQNIDFKKNYVQLPIQRLKELIEYKPQLLRFELTSISESYSSGSSALAVHPIKIGCYNNVTIEAYFKAMSPY